MSATEGVWDMANIEQAMVTDEILRFTVFSAGEDYTVILRPAAAGPPWWKGRHESDAGDSGHVEARRYTSVDGGVCLVGGWVVTTLSATSGLSSCALTSNRVRRNWRVPRRYEDDVLKRVHRVLVVPHTNLTASSPPRCSA